MSPSKNVVYLLADYVKLGIMIWYWNYEVNYRKLYRYFNLNDKHKAMVEENSTQKERTYDTLTQFAESKIPKVDDLHVIQILKRCKCDQRHIEFVADYDY